MLKVHDTLHERYLIRDVQDQNALRTVYRARDRWDASRDVMVNEFTVPSQDAAQFKRQLDALKGLKHNSLPHVRGIFEQNGLHYLVTDAVEGRPLSDLIKSGLSLSDAVRYVGQIAEALAICHQAGVIHRDVRPQNIIISAGRAVLMNFGLMKLKLDDGQSTAQFIKGWGTPPYAAPEQYGIGAGVGAVGTDERSDIYALGATLYYALTGREPVPASDQVSGEPLPAPSRLVSGIPEYLEEAVERAMSLDAPQRFESAYEFKQAISGVVRPATRTVGSPYAAPVAVPVINAQVTMDRGAPASARRATQLKQPTTTHISYASNRLPDSTPAGKPEWLKAAIAGLVVIALAITAVLVLEIVRSGSNPAGLEPAASAGVDAQARTPTPAQPAQNAQTPVVTAQAQTQPGTGSLSPALVVTATQALQPTPPAAPQPTQPALAQQAPTWQEAQFDIGNSVQGRPLTVYKLGNGPVLRVLIGAIHGGYEWNTAVLMTRTLEYLRRNPDDIPPQVTVYILPIANPDGYATSTDRFTGRPNANLVDLNRNWDFNWQMTATHGTRPVFAGDFAFSEPETVAMRDFLTGTLNLKQPYDAVIFYHSAFTAIFAGAGTTNTLTTQLAQVMSKATGYRILPGVQGQITTGDSIDYLTAKAGITAIEMELRTHQDIDWDENLRGLTTFLNWNLPSAPQPAESQPEPQPQPVNADPQATTAVNPAPRPGATRVPTPNCPQPYVVQPGELLGQIALNCDVAVGSIVKANNIANPDQIRAGEELIIPAE